MGAKLPSFSGPAQLPVAYVTGRAWYFSSREHDKIFRQYFACCSTDYTLNALCVWQSPPASYICVVCYLHSYCSGAICTHTQLYPWYHSPKKIYTAVSHFSVVQVTESLGGGLGIRLQNLAWVMVWELRVPISLAPLACVCVCVFNSVFIRLRATSCIML